MRGLWIAASLGTAACTGPTAPTDGDDTGEVVHDGQPELLSLSVTELHFGEQRMGEQAVPKQVRVGNLDDAPVEFQTAFVVDESQGFYVDRPPSGVWIEPGEEVAFEVRWRPVRLGSHLTEVLVQTTLTPTGSQARLTADGTGIAGELAASPDTVTILRDATVASVPVALTNPGDVEVLLLEATSEGNPGVGVDLDPARNGELPIALPPTDPDTGRPSRTIFVTWSPDLDDGSPEATVTLRSDAWLDRERVVSVRVE